MIKTPPSKNTTQILEQAQSLVINPALAAALAVAVDTPSLWLGSRDGARRFLLDRGIEIPPNVEVRFTQDDPVRSLTVATTLAARIVNSQTYWVARGDGSGYELVTWCRGFEITPRE